MKNYEQCITELRAYKGHVVALQEDLEEVEKENNTLRMITEKSEQGRRMSILITENEALFQSNRTLCDQLEDLEIELEDKENEESVTIDIEKTKLRRQSEAFLQQNEQLEQELKELKDEDEEKWKDLSNLRRQKEALDNKINHMTDLVSESDEKVAALEREKQELKRLLDKMRIETTNQELQMKNITNKNQELTLKNSTLEVALSENSMLDSSLHIVTDERCMEASREERTPSLDFLNENRWNQIYHSPQRHLSPQNSNGEKTGEPENSSSEKNSDGFHSGEESIEI